VGTSNHRDHHQPLRSCSHRLSPHWTTSSARFMCGASRVRWVVVCLLRIEDHDRARSPAGVRARHRGRPWRGWASRADAPHVRAERSDPRSIRRRWIHWMVGGLVYACECSRADIAARMDQGARGVGRRCSGTAVPLARAGRGSCRIAPRAWNARVPCVVGRAIPGLATRTPGNSVLRSNAEICSRRRYREGDWTYQFAAAVDDYHQGITLVVARRRLTQFDRSSESSSRGCLDGISPPAFLSPSNPLIMKNDAQKLSKSDGDNRRSRNFRALGWSPAQVIGHAAALSGARRSSGRAFPADQIPALVERRQACPRFRAWLLRVLVTKSRARCPFRRSPAGARHEQRRSYDT